MDCKKVHSITNEVVKKLAKKGQKRHPEKQDYDAWLCDMDGPPAHTTASTVPGGSRIQETTRSAQDKLERHIQDRITKIGTHWEDAADLDRRAASKRGPVHPHGCRLNQGQGQRRHISKQLTGVQTNEFFNAQLTTQRSTYSTQIFKKLSEDVHENNTH